MILKQLTNFSFFVLAEFRLFAIWCGRYKEALVVFLDCSRSVRLGQKELATTHVLLEHGHTMEAQWYGLLCQFANIFMKTRHLVARNDSLTLLIFLHAVNKFVVFYAKVASFTDSDRHRKIFQSLYHWPVCYRIPFLVPSSFEKRPSFSCVLTVLFFLVCIQVQAGVFFRTWKFSRSTSMARTYQMIQKGVKCNILCIW